MNAVRPCRYRCPEILRGGALRFRMAPTSPKRSGPGGVRALPPAPAAPLIAYLSCNVVPDMTISSSARGLVLCGLLAAAGTVLAQSATTTRSSNTLQPITTPTPVQPTVAPPRPVQPTPR